MYFKLTDENGRTQNELQWGPGVSHRADGEESRLCTSGCIHFYRDERLAVLMNPIHADFARPRMWECEAEGEIIHEPLKSGAREVKTIREIPVIEITVEQAVRFAVLCALELSDCPATFRAWAGQWLSGDDRTADSARAAAAAADAAYAAAYSNAVAYTDAATAAHAANAAAAHAANAAAAHAAVAARTAANAAAGSAADYSAAYGAAYGARAAAYAARAANQAIDFVALARRAVS